MTTRVFWLPAVALTVGLWTGLPRAAEAQDELVFTGWQRLTNREMALQLNASTNLYCRVEATSDLVQWCALATALNSGILNYTDSAAPFLDTRFYRAYPLTGTNIVTGDHLVTDNGDVIIHPINHASFVLQWQDKMIYVDPVGASTLYQGLARADLILITHEHSDHFDTNTIAAVKGTNALIIAPRTVYQSPSLSTALKNITTVMTNGQADTVMNLAIDAVPAYNLTASQHPKGVGNGYILTIGRKRIYISSDTDNTPEVRALRNIDVAFVGMRPPYSMSVAQAAEAVRAFQPRVVYPDHYLGNDVGKFKQLVGTDLGIEVRLRKWY